jgi:hypothetical protein
MNFKLLLVVIALISINAFSQKIDQTSANNALNWTIKEKVKISPEKIKEFQKQIVEFETQNNNTKSVNFVNNPISAISTPESEVHAAINPTDSTNIVVSPIRSDASSGISCPIYYTKDFGQTWNTSSFVNMPYEAGKMSMGGGDPVFVYDADGRAFFSWIDLYGSYIEMFSGPIPMGIFWAYSDDGGENWVRPTNDTVLLGHMNVLTNEVTDPISDKQWMASDRTGGTYNNNVYISFVTIGQRTNGDAFYQIKCKTKPAGIDNFTIEANVTDTAAFMFTQFSSLDVDNNGNIHVSFYGASNGTFLALWHSVSSDGGNTFSTPNIISYVKFNLPIFQVAPYDTIPGVNSDRTYPSPYFAADQNSGNLYITWTAFGITSDAGTKSDVYFSRSIDNGSSWSTAIKVNNDGLDVDNYYPSIIVNEDGVVKITWYDRRSDVANNVNTNYYLAESFDGGLTFPINYRVTTEMSDFSQIGSQNSNFGIGEYTQVLTTKTYTIPIWSDGRTNDGGINIYSAFLSDETVGIERIQTISENISMKYIYPNPVSNEINVDYNINKSSDIKISLYSVDGKLVKTFTDEKDNKIGTHHEKYNISGIESGTYFVVLNSDFGNITKKVTIK